MYGMFFSYETQRHGMVFVYDMSGSKYANFDYELSIKILTMLKVSCLLFVKANVKQKYWPQLSMKFYFLIKGKIVSFLALKRSDAVFILYALSHEPLYGQYGFNRLVHESADMISSTEGG